MEIAPEKFERFSYRELQKAAKSQGLNAGGKRETILKRLQDAVASQQKENAASIKPKHFARPKENDTHVVPRRTRAMASSGASPRLQKKALGQISLNSSRANQRLVILSHEHKTRSSLAAASVAEPKAVKPATAAMDDPTSEEKTSTAVENKTDARNESNPAAALSLAVEAGQRAEAAVPVATDVVQGRPSMMVATANPRLQETSALPRGAVVRVRLFSEQTVPEVMQKENTTDVAESAGTEEPDQQEDEGGHEVVAEERPETVKPPHQVQEEDTPVVTVVTACVPGVVSSDSVAVPPEVAAGGEQQVETSVHSLLPEAEQDKDGQQECDQQQQGGEMAAPVSKESAAAGVGEVTPVIQVQPAVTEKEHVLEVEEAADATTPEPDTAAAVVEGHDADAGMGKGPSSSARLEMELTLTTVLPSEETGKDDQAPVSLSQQPADEVVATEKAHELAEEAAAAEHEVGVGDECREAKGAVVVMPQHAGLVVDAETRSLVEESKYFQFADDERSVLCTLTGKKITPAYDNILLHMGSRKVQRLMVEGPFRMTAYEGMFMVEDPADDGFVFCELTGVRLFKSKAAVDQHINSQTFKEMMAIIRAKLDV